MNDTFYMQFFCGNQRKSLLQIKTHLVAKTAGCTGACAVAFGDALVYDVPKQFQVLLHGRKIKNSAGE